MTWKEEKESIGKAIAEKLYEKGMIRTWYRHKPDGWTLHSGIWSPFYINLRKLGSYPDLFKMVGEGLAKLIENDCPDVTKIVGIATAGVPIAASVGICGQIPVGYTRKMEGVKTIDDFREKITEYGQHTIVEGDFNDGDNVALIDDLVTRLTSKLIAVEQFKAEMNRRGVDAHSDTIIVLLDREQGAAQMAEDNGLKLLSLIPFQTKAIEWLKDKFAPLEYETLKDYLRNTEKYQDESIQDELKKQAEG